MATAVPYTGAPTVSPQLNPTPQMHVDSPVAAFGGAVAGAITHAGETAQGAGKELFDRAYAMQQFNEDVKADARASDAADKSVQEYLELAKRHGQQAQEYLPTYNRNLDQIREDGAKDLSPYARAKYLGDTRRFQTGMLWRGGVIAREGLDQAGDEAHKAWMDSTGNGLAQTDPQDPNFRPMLDDMQKKGEEYYINRKGDDPETARRMAARDVSSQAMKTAKNLYRTNPVKAQDFVDQGVKAGYLHPEDAAAISGPIENAVNTKAAHSVAAKVSAGDPSIWGKDTVPAGNAVDALAKSPGGTGQYNSVGNKLPDGSYPVGHYGVNSKLLGAELPKANLMDESGNAVTTEEQFRNSAKAQDDFAKAVFPRLQREQGGFAKAQRAWTGDDSPQRLNTMLGHVAKTADPEIVRDKARTEMGRQAPNNPEAQSHAADVAEANQVHQKELDAKSNQQLRQDTLAVIDGHDTDGKVPISLQEALENPKFADAYNRLDSINQDAVQKIIKKNSLVGGVVENPKGNMIFMHMMRIGRERETATPEELEYLANLDPEAQSAMTRDQRKQLLPLQAAVLRQEAANPDVKRAMGLPAVQQLLKDSGIDKQSNPDAYSKFYNSFHDALMNQGAGAGRPIKNDAEVLETAKTLVKPEIYNSNHWYRLWGQNKQPYEQDPLLLYPKNKQWGMDYFSKQNGRPPDMDNTEDYNKVGQYVLQAIYTKLGADSKPKRTDRAQ